MSRLTALTRFSAGVIAATLLSSTALAQTAIEMRAERFDLSHARNVEFREINGETALCFAGGAVLVRDVALADGTLSVDIANESHRHFANLVFRAESVEDHEAAYVRMHKSRQVDTLQYNPHIRGESHWQLFAPYMRMADLGEADWITLSVAYAEDRARVSVETSAGTFDQPVGDLALDTYGEQIGLRALFPTCFANLRYDDATPDLSEIAPTVYDTASGQISTWSLSEATQFEGFADTMMSDEAWGEAEVDANGTLLVSRYRAKPSSGGFERNGLDVVYASTTIVSDRARVVALDFDVSDIGRIYLNGQPLVEINNAFRAKHSNVIFRGDFDVNTQTVMLALDEGENDLVIGVAERANGWALAARLQDMTGLALR